MPLALASSHRGIRACSPTPEGQPSESPLNDHALGARSSTRPNMRSRTGRRARGPLGFAGTRFDLLPIAEHAARGIKCPPSRELSHHSLRPPRDSYAAIIAKPPFHVKHARWCSRRETDNSTGECAPRVSHVRGNRVSSRVPLLQSLRTTSTSGRPPRPVPQGPPRENDGCIP